MRTVSYSQYGGPDVAQLATVDVPTLSPTDVLVRVEAATVSAADSAARLGKEFAARLYFGLRSPRFPVLGSDFAGTVEAVGSSVVDFAVGDAVVGSAASAMGAHAEFVRIGEAAALAHRPTALSAVDVVSVTEGGITALHFMRDIAAVKQGDSVLVIGASGSVGSSAVQLARHFGARVTAVCSARNASLARSLGATEVIDYESADFTATGETYDVIFDAVAKRSYHAAVGSLSANGVYLSTVPNLGILVPALATKWSRGKRARIGFAGLRPAAAMRADLVTLVSLAEEGVLVPVRGGTFAFEDAAAAYELVDSGRKTGTVVVVP